MELEDFVLQLRRANGFLEALEPPLWLSLAMSISASFLQICLAEILSSGLALTIASIKASPSWGHIWYLGPWKLKWAFRFWSSRLL